MSETWRLLLSGDATPAEAMAVDEALFTLKGPPTLRLYRWRPHAVSLGYFQKAGSFDLNQFARERVPVVRRLTGGGAIFHGDEVTFSITADAPHALFRGAVRESYDRVHAILADAIANCCPARTAITERKDTYIASDVVDSPWCFHESTEFDLVAAARKLVGSAQRRAGGRVLHHGSIVLRANRYTPEVASVESLGGDARPEAVERSIVEAMSQRLQILFMQSNLSPDERSLAGELAEKKYLSEAWTLRR